MTSTINKSGWLAAGVLSLFVVAAMTGVVRGGPLDPPGAPASTGKGQISALPATINTPGSYIVTANLIGSGTGITINASNVTIDFQGFTVAGPGSGSPGTGVNVPAAQKNVTLKNGTLSGWTSGVAAANTTYARIDGLAVMGAVSGPLGTGLSVGSHSIVQDCNVSGFSDVGVIASFSTVRDCVVTDNVNVGVFSSEGSYIYSNLIRNNGIGFYSYGPGLKAGADFNYVRNNHICYNTSDIQLGGASEGKNAFVGNTFGTSNSVADASADVYVGEPTTSWAPDLNNIRLGSADGLQSCAR